MSFVGGLPETRCGGGSTMEATKNVRAHLLGLLRDYGVKTLLDAPCGDCNWIAHTDLAGIRYIGIDFDAEHVAAATVRGFNAMLGDIVNGHLPAADMMLCRDFLQHLPTAQVRQTIQNFKASNIPWLLATSHETSQNDDIERAGDFRPLNLMVRPLGFPDPVEKIEDGPRRILGLWRREDVPA
jgi:hypothetical protein